MTFSNGEKVRGNGNFTTSERNVEGTDRIKVSDAIDVILLKGQPHIKVEADENLMPYIETKTENGWLVIRAKDDYDLSSKNRIVVYVTTPELSALKVAGSGKVESKETWGNAEDFELGVAGSGDVSITVASHSMDVNIAGSSNVEVKGDAKDIKVDIAGSGSFMGGELKANDVGVSVAGSGDAEVFAMETLKVKVAGSGDVKYRGNATVDQKIVGSGSVRKLD
jgi:hypothetical protein